jgi:hypothetical protein
MSTTLQNFYKTTITRNWTATTGDFNVAEAPVPTSGWIVVSPNNSTLREIVFYTAIGTNAYGPFITVSTLGGRGVGGTTAQTHTIGESVRMNITAQHLQEISDEITAIVAAGAADASTTAKGLVEEITEAEILSVTDIGGTGAKLFTPPSLMGSFSKTISVSSAEILALHTTPKTLVAAPGAGKAIIVDEVIYSFTAGTQYANGDQLTCRYNGDTTIIFVGPTAANINSASSSIVSAYPAVANTVIVPTNVAFELKLLSATAFITGTGTLKVFIKYRILTL